VSFDRHRFFVTGAAGFVGANLVRRLLERGAEVHALVKPATRSWRIADLAGRLHVHHADLTDPAAVDRVVDAIRPTVIYHLATHGAYHYQNEAEQILLVNIAGLWNVHRACARHGFHLFVNTGSSSEYGAKMFAMRESDVLDPNSFYAVAKAAQSHLCQHIGRTAKNSTVTLRLFSVYGPYEEPKRLVPNLMLAALDGTPLDMVSPETVRDFVYIDDVIDVYLEIDKLQPLSGEILNVGTGVQTSLAQLVDTMATVAGRPLQAHWDQMPPRTWDAAVWVADVSKLRWLTGSVPRTRVDQGLARTLAWFREHHRFYRNH